MDTVVRALGLAPKFVLVSQMLLVFRMGPELGPGGPSGQWTVLNLTASRDRRIKQKDRDWTFTSKAFMKDGLDFC